MHKTRMIGPLVFLLVISSLALGITSCKKTKPSSGGVVKSNQQRSRSLRIKPESFDFGAIQINKPVTRNCSLKLINESRKPAKVTQISLTCKCIHLDADRFVGQTIPAQGQLEIPFDVEFTSQSGEFRQAIQITFDHEDSATIT